MQKMLIRLLRRGDDVSIECGRLVVRPRSKKDVPQEWMNEHSEALIREIFSGLGLEAYRYYEYETGNYVSNRSGGVTLQFRSVMTRSYAYTIYNVELSRARNTKTGKNGGALPPRQFRIKSQRCGFYKFWERSGLKIPGRLSVFHDYMGNLKEILFAANYIRSDSDRLDRKTLRPLSVTAAEIKRAFLPDKTQTVSRQMADNARTNLPDKESASSLEVRGLQTNSNTCSRRYGKAVNRSSVVVPPLPPSSTPPGEQDIDEWTERYCSPA